MTKVPSWNDIPWDEQAEPVEKADQFDRQYAENQANAKEDDSNPYSPENFPPADRRK